MKSALVIDAPDAFFDFLKTKFATEDVAAVSADCNRDAFMKMMSTLPDLVILDMQRGFEDILNLLKQKRSNPNTQRMPVIAIGPVVDKTQTAMFAQFGVIKYFTRPLEADVFFSAAADAMGTDVSIDPTPGQIDIRRKAGVIYIDLAGALNRDKLSVLNMDLVDLIADIQTPKIVCLMSNLHPSFLDAVNLEYLFDGILASPRVQAKNVKVIVNDPFICDLLDGHKHYSGIERAADISAVLNSITDISASADPKQVIADQVLGIDMNSPTLTMSAAFSTDPRGGKGTDDGNVMRTAIVDVDANIRKAVVLAFKKVGATCDEFAAGADVLKAVAGKHYDLVIMDLMLPDGSAFPTLKKLSTDSEVPVIVHSRPQSKEEVKKVLSLGVRRYLIKPLGNFSADNLVKQSIALMRG